MFDQYKFRWVPLFCLIIVTDVAAIYLYKLLTPIYLKICNPSKSGKCGYSDGKGNAEYNTQTGEMSGEYNTQTGEMSGEYLGQTGEMSGECYT